MDVSNVLRGIEFLDKLATEGTDEAVRENWREEIDWSEDRFNMSEWANCAWGQLHKCQGWSEYVDSLRDAGLSTHIAREDHGFEVEEMYTLENEEEELTELWQMYANHTPQEDLPTPQVPSS